MSIFKVYPRTDDLVAPGDVSYFNVEPPQVTVGNRIIEELSEENLLDHLNLYRDNMVRMEKDLEDLKVSKQVSIEAWQTQNRRLNNLIDNFTGFIKDAIVDERGLSTAELLEFAVENDLDIQQRTTVEFNIDTTVTVVVTHIGELDLDDIQLDVSSYDGEMSVDFNGEGDVEIDDVSYYINSREEQ